MAWRSKQFFANEAAFGPNEQIVDQGRVGFGDASQFDPIDFQGPVRVGGPLLPTLPFARPVVQIFTSEESVFPQTQQVFCISTMVWRRLHSL